VKEYTNTYPEGVVTMFEGLNNFFLNVYAHNRYFYSIQAFLVIFLAGINLGLLSQFFFRNLAEKTKDTS
jgi:hypothetical protein